MHRTIIALTTIAFLGSCSEATPVTPVTAGSTRHATSPSSERRYEVVRLESLGGSDSRGHSINNRGWVAGQSQTADGERRAVLWRTRFPESLGTLGGRSSSVPRASMSNSGLIVGVSQVGELDDLNEQWSCEGTGALLPTDPRQACRGFFWDGGTMRELQTLGGTHAYASSVNSRGQVVGWAETDVIDPTCTGVQRRQFRAALWEPRRGSVQELPPFPGDSASAATAINERGQVVGISGDCDQAIGQFSARRAVLWESDTVVALPDLGGASWHTPWAINQQGDVVGFSNLPESGDPAAFNSHAFYWKYGSDVLKDLNTLPGNLFSQANGINVHGQIIGVSHGGPGGTRAFLFDLRVDNVMVDLNALVELADDEVFEIAHDINDAGQIAGRLLNRTTGVRTAVIATPRR